VVVVAVALGGESLGKPPPVLAVVVVHVLVPGPHEGGPVGGAGPALHPAVGTGRARQRLALPHGRAPDGGVVPVGHDEGRVGPVHGHGPVPRRPPAPVPDGRVHPHRLAPRVGVVRVAVEHAHDLAVHSEHHVAVVPEDGVRVEVRGGVEPEAELLLLAPVAVGAQHHGRAGAVAHELHVDLVVPRVVARRQVEGGHGARGWMLNSP
jgi:hypothetical protein